jgi:hypothetical protein
VKLVTTGFLSIFFLLAGSRPMAAFCGFYVAKADAKLFNRASQVAIVRHEDKTVLTMANDFRGNLREFAVVIPVPTFITKEQIHVGKKALLDRLDAYSAPRLVEYFDPDPCQAKLAYPAAEALQGRGASNDAAARREKSLGVTIEARYTVGEYDILILSAKESGGLETWLRESGYRIPDGAGKVLDSYIRQRMRFFVARVNLAEQAKLGFSFLRPIQVAYESPKFMLPIRLGTVNADGPQELFVFTLTRKGRVETTNYRTVRLASDMDVPVFVKQEFPRFYKSLFSRQVRKEQMHAVFLEYAWDMAWCDPCAADPLTREELRQLGVFWLEDAAASGQAQDVFLTRLHVRYDAARFPEDLVFQETGDRSNFQGRYVLRHPFAGDATCEAAEGYREEVRRRQEEEARTLAGLTGWRLDEIRRRMKLDAPVTPGRKWYEKIWR